MSYVTGISGNVISAASAGFAPTNSADVSAIASSYAESAASGKLDSSASSSFYTTANESSFIDSAYLDSALTDFGTVVSNSFYSTSNPSAFVTSGDLDSALNDFATIVNTNFYPTSNPSGFITGVDLSNYATTGYVDSSVSGKLDSSASSSFYTTANESGFVDSAYVDSAVSVKADSSALSSYALSSDVSGVIDTVSSNSASWGGGATGDYVETSSTEVAIGSANTASSNSLAQGNHNSANSYSLAQGYYNSANSYSFAQGSINRASFQSFAQGGDNSAKSYSFAQGYENTASDHSFAQGRFNSAINSAAVFGRFNLKGNGDTSTGHSAAFAIGDGTANTARHDLMLVTKDGEITMYSSTADTVGTGIMSSIRAISAAATGGGVDSATVSAIASAYQVVSSLDTSHYNYNGTWVTGVKRVNGRLIAATFHADGGELATKNDISGVIDTVSSNSASWGGGGVDSATVSSIASSYAQDVSAAASGTVDLVSTQSANWGGSALGLSAGPGVKLEKVGDTLVAGLDETVLWSGSGYAVGDTSQSFNLSESPLNFSTIKVYGYRPLGTLGTQYAGMFSEEIDIGWLTANSINQFMMTFTVNAGSTYYVGGIGISGLSSTSWTETGGWHSKLSETSNVCTTGAFAHVHKVVGINRTAGV